jgi:hypothetical protein
MIVKTVDNKCQKDAVSAMAAMTMTATATMKMSKWFHFK